MSQPVRILNPLGTCAVGDFLGVEIDGAFLEGRISFITRTPSGGWIVTFEAADATYEVFCANGTCTLVSQLTQEAWSFAPESRPVADTTTGRRYALSNASR